MRTSMRLLTNGSHAFGLVSIDTRVGIACDLLLDRPVTSSCQVPSREVAIVGAVSWRRRRVVPPAAAWNGSTCDPHEPHAIITLSNKSYLISLLSRTEEHDSLANSLFLLTLVELDAICNGIHQPSFSVFPSTRRACNSHRLVQVLYKACAVQTTTSL